VLFSYFYLYSSECSTVKAIGKRLQDLLPIARRLKEHISDKLLMDKDKTMEMGLRTMRFSRRAQRFSILRERRAWNQEICKT
jgi:hypothetical protein